MLDVFLSLYWCTGCGSDGLTFSHFCDSTFCYISDQVLVSLVGRNVFFQVFQLTLIFFQSNFIFSQRKPAANFKLVIFYKPNFFFFFLSLHHRLGHRLFSDRQTGGGNQTYPEGTSLPHGSHPDHGPHTGATPARRLLETSKQ